MSNFTRLIGVFFAVLMCTFSAFMFLKTGDWVAAVFFLGSAGYGVFFATSQVSRYKKHS